jgi:hypothetical protein
VARTRAFTRAPRGPDSGIYPGTTWPGPGHLPGHHVAGTRAFTRAPRGPDPGIYPGTTWPGPGHLPGHHVARTRAFTRAHMARTRAARRSGIQEGQLKQLAVNPLFLDTRHYRSLASGNGQIQIVLNNGASEVATLQPKELALREHLNLSPHPGRLYFCFFC